MHHRLSGITLSVYRLNGLGKGNEHPTYAPVEYGTFTFLCNLLSLSPDITWRSGGTKYLVLVVIGLLALDKLLV